jgi:hypothetical protein
MARLIFNNISFEEARELAHWYKERAELSAADWLDENGMRGNNVLTDIGRLPHWYQLEGDDMNVYLKGGNSNAN